MNKSRLLLVADAIEQSYRNGSAIKGLGFNMSDWITKGSEDKTGHNCGTTACIAGWAQVLKYRGRAKSIAPIKVQMEKLTMHSVEYEAKEWFEPEGDREEAQISALFYVQYGKWYEETIDMDTVEPWHAVHALRTLVETGNFNWWYSTQTQALPKYTEEELMEKGLAPAATTTAIG